MTLPISLGGVSLIKEEKEEKEEKEGNIFGNSPLMRLSETGKLNIICKMCSSNINLQKIINMQDNKGWYALLLALCNEHIKIAEIFINNGSNINMENYLGWTPLYVAVSQGYTNIVKLLINKGAKLDKIYKNGSNNITVRENQTNQTYFFKKNAYNAQNMLDVLDILPNTNANIVDIHKYDEMLKY